MKFMDKWLSKIGYTKSTTWGKLWKIAQEQKLFGNTVQDPFKQVPNVYKSVKAIADNVPQAQLKFYNWNTQDEVNDPLLERLFERPNPIMSYGDFLQAVVGFYALFGETKIIKAESIGGKARKLTTGLYPIKPSKLEPIHNENRFPPELSGWRSGQTTFLPEDIIFARDFNPNGYFTGVPPTEPLKKVIDIDWKGLCFNSAFFENSATLGLALSTDKSLSNDQRKRLEEWVQHHYKGHTKAFRTIVLEAGLEAKSIGSTHKDMDFIEQMKYTREETLGVWRVPKALFNITDDLNYACIVEGERVYTVRGSIKVEDVEKNDEVFTFGNEGLEKKKVLNSWKQGEKESYSLKTNHREIKTSYDHPILCLERQFESFEKYPFYKGKGVLSYKKMENIERGDYVVVADQCDNEMNTVYPSDFCEFVGAFIGDGCFQNDNRQVSFAIPKTQEQLRQRYIDIAKKEFKYKKKGMNGDKGDGVIGTISENSISFAGDTADRLKGAGCIQGSKKKRVPDWVYRTTRENKLAFLKGYADTDGSLQKRGNLVFTCANKDLMYDLASLCDYLGLRRTNIAEEIRVTNFSDESKVWRFSITYPDEIDSIKNSDRLTGKTDRGHYKGRMTTALDVLPEGFHIEKVKSKTNIGTKTVYDLEVEGRHNFLCGGVVVHNTFVGQMKVFWLYGLMPILRKLEDVFNKDLIYPYNPNIYCKFDIANVPAFKEDFKDKIEQATLLFSIGIPLNDIIHKLDLPFDEVDGGDTGYIPFSLMPMGSAGHVGTEPEKGTKAVESKEVKKEEVDGLIWKSFLNRHSVLENRFKSSLSRYFFEQRKRVLEQVNKKSAETINIDINWESENEELQKMAKPYLLGGIMAGIDFGKEMLQQEVEEQILNYEMRNLLANGTRTITRINDTVREQTEQELAEAIKNGETVQQASDRIRGVYNNATSRTKVIARTEMTNVMNGGNHLYATQAGAELKRWVTAGDEAVRPRHRALGGMPPIRIEESFSNGLMYPGEKGGSAGEVINCRCVLQYVLKEGE